MAVTLTAAALAERIVLPSGRAEELLAVGSALVERYAPAAPSALQDEAVIRCAAWMHSRGGGDLAVRSRSAGGLRVAYDAQQRGALRSSGAMALLSSWKVRRAL